MARGAAGFLGIVALLVALGHVVLNGAAPLPAPPPLDAPLPPASPPPGVQLAVIRTGVTHRSAAFAYRGGSLFDARDFAMNAVLIRHPRGDLLLDTGLGRDVDLDFAAMPFYFRLATRYRKDRPAADQLRAAGYNPGRLRILLTHAHWDHASGLSDFPGGVVLVPEAERRFVAEGGDFLTAAARRAKDVRWETYAFEGGPYLGFPAHHDVYGDGSVVTVPAPGHTPGSVIVFVTLPDGARWAFLGDLSWQLEGVLEREERPWPARAKGDADQPALRESLLRANAIATRYPQIHLVPAHDARGYVGIPELVP
jgi:glyoxylase-like metal-dependent hydrolase (beta-lactamase superfamily II)